jgi:predicted DCC family thiol-disulfide oxidoreductase YuxK
MQASDDYLLYDGDCPACHRYVEMSRLRQLYPKLRVLNARAEPALVAALRSSGQEINEGMVLSLDGRVYFGAEATRQIAILGRSVPSLWRRTLLAAFGTAPWARALYPVLNGGRKILLRLLGRPPIR